MTPPPTPAHSHITITLLLIYSSWTLPTPPVGFYFIFISPKLVADLANDMVRNGVIPSDWEDSFVINIYKGKGDALERGNYRGLKLLDHVMKGIEKVIEKIIRERISIDDMQFGFMPDRGTTDAIFILRQLQEKHLAKNKKLYFAFVDLEKAFDRVPRKVIWWAMRKLGIEEWIVRFVQAMYNNTRSRVKSQ